MELILSTVAISVLAVALALRNEKKFVKNIQELDQATSELKSLNERLALLETMKSISVHSLPSVGLGQACFASRSQPSVGVVQACFTSLSVERAVGRALTAQLEEIENFYHSLYGIEKILNIEEALESIYETNVRSKKYLISMSNDEILSSRSSSARARSPEFTERPISVNKYFEPLRSCNV